LFVLFLKATTFI